MAHIIAKNADGPRGNTDNENDNTYDNLLLLCPNCHTKIDKTPDDYPFELLREWKRFVEEKYEEFISSVHFSNKNELKESIKKYLIENKISHDYLGPKSKTAQRNPNSNLSLQWQYKKLEVIIPNNKKIISIIEKNTSLLSPEELELFYIFKEHALAFERHQYSPIEDYPLFPKEFEEIFSL
ncbi:hypothetical protein BWD08_10185 [Neisseria animaloris]|nr:hypothetical protein BWD08_10185 [Neisseria animaloris]